MRTQRAVRIHPFVERTPGFEAGGCVPLGQGAVGIERNCTTPPRSDSQQAEVMTGSPPTAPRSLQPASGSKAAGDVTEIVEMDEGCVGLPSPHFLESSLRLLARWLVAETRGGAPGGPFRPPADPQNPVDVAPDSKVVSEPG